MEWYIFIRVYLNTRNPSFSMLCYIHKIKIHEMSIKVFALLICGIYHVTWSVCDVVSRDGVKGPMLLSFTESQTQTEAGFSPVKICKIWQLMTFCGKRNEDMINILMITCFVVCFLYKYPCLGFIVRQYSKKAKRATASSNGLAEIWLYIYQVD